MITELSLLAAVLLPVAAVAAVFRFRRKALHRELRRIRREIHEEERQTLARELHDNIGQLLAAARLLLRGTPADATGSSDAGDLIGRAIREIRVLTRNLLKPEDPALDAALRRELLRAGRYAPTPPELQVQGVPFRLSPDRAMLFFRIFQQLLDIYCTQAATGEIRVKYAGDRIQLSFAGFPPQKNGAEWEVILRRINLLQGKMSFLPDAEGISTLELVCPREWFRPFWYSAKRPSANPATAGTNR